REKYHRRKRKNQFSSESHKPPPYCSEARRQRLCRDELRKDRLFSHALSQLLHAGVVGRTVPKTLRRSRRATRYSAASTMRFPPVRHDKRSSPPPARADLERSDQNCIRTPNWAVVGTPPARSVVRFRKSVERRSPVGFSKLARLATLNTSTNRSRSEE